MKILITGNLGYVGPALTKQLRRAYPDATLVGYDAGYFANCLTTSLLSPETALNEQHYGDVRAFPARLLADVDTVVCLSAISNDPIGNKFEAATLDINFNATATIARLAKAQGVRRFVFASSCSVYGFAEEAPRTESSTTNPLTAYAKSKVYSEQALAPLADDTFQVTCLRFATACGMSDRLRLDLVLNDFVAGALASGEINILSDGSPWRPLINVKDMALAINWANQRSDEAGGPYLVVNTGSNAWNYQVKDLAHAIADRLPGTRVSINPDAQPDKRSYRVNFDQYAQLAPHHQPQYDLATTIDELVAGLQSIGFRDANYRQSPLIRLHVISNLLAHGLLDDQLHLVP